MPKRPASMRKKRIRLWESKANHTCALCGVEFTSFDETTVDHIVELSKGGSNNITNLQLAHEACNNKKSNFHYNWERMKLTGTKLTFTIGELWQKGKHMNNDLKDAAVDHATRISISGPNGFNPDQQQSFLAGAIWMLKSGAVKKLFDAASNMGTQCANTGMYGQLGLSPGECTCSRCDLKKTLKEFKDGYQNLE